MKTLDNISPVSTFITGKTHAGIFLFEKKMLNTKCGGPGSKSPSDAIGCREREPTSGVQEAEG
jgi:hypothetical protein